MEDEDAQHEALEKRPSFVVVGTHRYCPLLGVASTGSYRRCTTGACAVYVDRMTPGLQEPQEYDLTEVWRPRVRRGCAVLPDLRQGAQGPAALQRRAVRMAEVHLRPEDRVGAQLQP